MCDICKHTWESYENIEYKIKSGRDRVINICPNCLSEAIYNGNLHIEKGLYVSEISNEYGAVSVKSANCEYFVTPEEAIRLLGHALMPNEFKKLIRNGHSPFDFELHDDFYFDDGLADQPVREDLYIRDLKNYLKTEKLSTLDKKRIKKHIEMMEGNED